MTSSSRAPSRESLGIRDPRPFVLLAGAGISLWHPASLPTWNEFNEVLLDEAKARAARELDAKSPVAPAGASISLQDIGSKAFSNMLVEMLSGEAYFDVLGGLDGDHPNDAHRAVARLARRGAIAAVVTTNFDTLFERAFSDEGVAFTGYSRPQDYWSNDPVGVPILKIHGSAHAEDGLIDTVGQKLRGLAPLVRARLSELFEAHPVLVVGFSGGDLEFGSDYLALHGVPAGPDRLIWTTRPGEPPVSDPALRQLVVSRGRFISISLADALRALGADPLSLEWNPDSRAQVLERLRKPAQALFKKAGNLNTLAFCMRLLSATGHGAMAADLWRQVADKVRGRKRQTMGTVGPAMRGLAAEGHRLFGILEQREWACRQVRDIEERRTRAGARYEVGDDAYLRDARGEALACLVLGETFVRSGDHYASGVAMETAMGICEHLGDESLLPAVYRLYGWREVVRLKQMLESGGPVTRYSDDDARQAILHESAALGFLMAAEAAGLVAGNVETLDCAWLSADLLMDLGEYDAAMLCLERLERRLGFGAHRETWVRIEALKGEIDVRQGHNDRAMARWTACLEGIARGNPLLEAYVKGVIIGRIGFAPEWRAKVLQFNDELLSAMESGVLPSDSRSDLLGTKAYFEMVRTNLPTAGDRPFPPGFMTELESEPQPDEAATRRWPEHQIRLDLIELEYTGDSRGVLDSLDRLVASTYVTGNGSALLRARAHLRRAELDGTDDDRFAAAVNVAAVRHSQGDTLEAPAWFASALDGPRARDPVARLGLEKRLPHGLWNTPEAEPANVGSTDLHLHDALAMRWKRPPTGSEREQLARTFLQDGNLLMARLLALEAIVAYQYEGLPGGFESGLRLLDEIGARDRRSGASPLSICSGV